MRSTGIGSGFLRSDGDEKELMEKMTDLERIHARASLGHLQPCLPLESGTETLDTLVDYSPASLASAVTVEKRPRENLLRRMLPCPLNHCTALAFCIDFRKYGKCTKEDKLCHPVPERRSL